MFVFDVIRNEMFVEMSLHKEGTYMGQGGESLNVKKAESTTPAHALTSKRVSTSFTVTVQSKSCVQVKVLKRQSEC